MLIILSFYALVAWLVFFKFKLLPWNRAWKTVVYGIAVSIGLVVVGALQYYTPVSVTAVVQNQMQKIAPLVGGEVISVDVFESQAVKMGDVLFRIDPEPYQYALSEREAKLRLAKIRLRDATYLVEKKAAAAATLDKYSAELDQAQAQRDSAQFDLDHTVVVAPADGMVAMAALYEGEVVSRMAPVLNFVRSGDIWIGSAFKQNGMEKIRVGTAATVIFSSAPGVIYDTTITRVAPASVQGQLNTQTLSSPLDAIMSATALYPVNVSFPADAPEYLHRSGTQASITVFTEEGHPINVLAKIVQWIGTWMAFVF